MKKRMALLLLAFAVLAQTGALADLERGSFSLSQLVNWSDEALMEAYGASSADFRPSNPQPLTYIASIDPVIDPVTGRESEGGYSREHRTHPISTNDAFWTAANLSAFGLSLTDDPNLATYLAHISYQYVSNGKMTYSNKKIPLYKGVLTVTLTNLLTGERIQAGRECYCFPEQHVRASIVDEGIGHQFYGGPGSLDSREISAFNEFLGLGVAALYNYVDDEGGGICLTKYLGEHVDALEIPSAIDGRPVTGIGKEAFRDIGFQTVTLPDTVTHIDERAFHSCLSLRSIVIPSSVTTISDNAFGYTGLEAISLPEGLTTLGSAAFYACLDLKRVELPSTLTAIADSAFDGTGITSIVIPDSVQSIGRWAFKSCSSLQSVSLPAGLREIGSMAFQYCSALQTVTLPAGVHAISDNLFEGCSTLTDVTCAGEIEQVGSEAFMNCEKLSSVTFQKGVKAVGTHAFLRCKRLKTLDLQGLTSLSDEAFSCATGLTSVILPETLTEIEGDPFKPFRDYREYNKTISMSKSFKLTVIEGSYAESWAKDAGVAYIAIAPPTEADLAERQYPALKTGAKGEAVRRLQQKLIDMGYLEGVADGQFGKKTAAAVAAAQEAMGMTADGVASGVFQMRLYGDPNDEGIASAA